MLAELSSNKASLLLRNARQRIGLSLHRVTKSLP